MCNLYRMTGNADVIAPLFAPPDTFGGNQPPLTQVFPDCVLPVVLAAEARGASRRLEGTCVGVLAKLRA